MLCNQPLVFILFDDLKCQQVKVKYHSDSIPYFRIGGTPLLGASGLGKEGIHCS